MSREINPAPGVRDQLGSPSVPWEKLYVKAIYDDTGKPVAFIPIDATDITTGVLDPDRITQLNPGVEITSVSNPTLADIIANAVLGATDPVTRINAGISTIVGTKIRDSTLPPNSIDPLAELTHRIFCDGGGGLVSSDYVAGTSGFAIVQHLIEMNVAAAVWRGILAGLINIANVFKVDAAGNLVVGNAGTNPNRLHGINNDGEEWWGSDIYANAPAQMDAWGNFFLTDGPNSLSQIDLGAIRAVCGGIIPSQAGGQFNGNLTLTPNTRGAHIYYTTDNSNPADPTNVNRHLYSVPFAVAPNGGPVIVKAVAQKLGVYGATFTWTFTSSATVCAAPTFSPAPGFYTSMGGTFPVTLLDGTAGATIRYTLDGSTPTAVNGLIYVGPIALSNGLTPIKAYALKAGLTDSAVVTGNYSIMHGGGPGGGGGHNVPP